MIKLIHVLLLLCLFTFNLFAADSVIAIRAGNLLNPDGKISQNVVILVRGDRIEKIGTENIPDGTNVIDLSEYTVLPGLIDCHTHILLQPEMSVVSIRLLRNLNHSEPFKV